MFDNDLRMLRESAKRFFADSGSIQLLRQRRDAGDLEGLARGCWDGMVKLGFAGILIPEEFGGAGLDSRAAVQISEMMGRTLATGPFLSSAVMAATAVVGGDNAALKAEMLPAIAGGEIVALAGEEAARHAPLAISTTVRRHGGAFHVSGLKIAVIGGALAQRLIVPARDAESPDRLLLLMIKRGADGVTLTRRMGLDSHPRVDIGFTDASATDLVCDPEMTRALLDRVYDAGRLHLAAEMLGAAQAAFDRTIEYLKTRVQFGRRIGEFQALQHRAAILFGELEIARSVLLKAASTGTALHVSMAKAKVGDVANRVAEEATQLHGGIGVTDEFDLGFFLKRIRAASQALGDSAFHAERYARMRGL